MTTAPIQWGDKRYHSLNFHLKQVYGEKIYKLALQGSMSCPNRDGLLDTRGCIFCSTGGSGDFAAPATMSITDQIAYAKTLVNKKTPKDNSSCSYIAYFQSYTNTYAPIDYLRRIFTEAIYNPDISILSIATRPDCLDADVIQLLTELNHIKPVWIELGLQTIHEETANFIRRGYQLSVFETAVNKLRKSNIEVITHLILGLPGETPEMMLASVDYLAHIDIQGIKLQLLHILEGTDLAVMYQSSEELKNKMCLQTMAEYTDLLISILELLPPDMVIHRLTGDAPRKLLISPLWSTDKKNLLNTVNQKLIRRNTWQGRLFTTS